MTAPDWLSKHDGGLQAGYQPFVTFVTLGGVPQYKLEVRPAGAAYTSYVVQSVNGRRVDDAKANYPTADAAVAGGLDQLRTSLGW
ncbi:hypothetical protein J0H58_26405 [bacterium]|nr:hypothetical protein [bacterium]